MHVRAIRVAAALLALPPLGARPSAQKPVNASPASPLLRLDVSVTDASGKPVPALRAARRADPLGVRAHLSPS
jgi:hypothetical protein